MALMLSAPAKAQDVEAPTSDDLSFSDIDAVRESVRRMQERLEGYRVNQPTMTTNEARDAVADEMVLEEMRAEAVEHLQTITALQGELGIEPVADESTLNGQRLENALAIAEEQIALLEWQKESVERRLTNELDAAYAEIEELQGEASLSASMIEDMNTSLITAKEELLAATKPQRDPDDVARLEEMERLLQKSQAEVAKLSEESASLRGTLERTRTQMAQLDRKVGVLNTDLGRCTVAKSEAETRAELPEARAWQSLQANNRSLKAENARADRQLADAMVLAERCVDQTGGRDDRLIDALRQIEILEAELAR